MPYMKKWKHDELLESVVAILLLIVFAGPDRTALCAISFGVNYGKVANNLPAPAEVVTLIQSIPFTKAKLYDPDPLVLKTFRNTDISFYVGVRNEDLAALGGLDFARTWVHDNVLAYYPSTSITGIVVGNEIFGGADTAQVEQVLPAMRNIYNVLMAQKLHKKIAVSTAHSFAVLTSSYPPSSGAFAGSIISDFMTPLLQFLASTNSPFMINTYPFFAYKDNPGEISLAYVLFENRVGTPDANNGLLYYNMFDAQVDAVYSAMSKLGFDNITICVSETGWPSAGDANEAGANVSNAQAYHTNLYRHLLSSKGTPLRRNASMEVFFFALFNENLKPGPTSERNYGFFKPDGSKVYSFNASISSSPAKNHGLFWAVKAGILLLTCLGLINGFH